MALPQPAKGESKKAFMDRCQKDTNTINTFPVDTERARACKAVWDKSTKKVQKTDVQMATNPFATMEVIIME